MNKGLIFFIGILLGVGATLGIGKLLEQRQSPAQAINNNIRMFKEPQGVLEYKHTDWKTGTKTYPYTEFKVFDVLANGYALADGKEVGSNIYSGITVLLLPLRNGCYYDEQIVSAPKGYCTRQIGVFNYENNMGVNKTVPVVRFYPK